MARDVHFFRDLEQGLDVLGMQVSQHLTERFDLKNQRVRELEARFDKIDRQVMQLQRREALCRMRRKVR